MPLDPAEQALLDDMKYRELTIKRKKRATDAILYRERRFRAGMLTVAAVFCAVLAALVLFEILRRVLDRVGWWLPGVVVVALCAFIGVELGRDVLRSRFGRSLMAKRERALRKRYAQELNTGRRWLQFYYKGEDIAPYVPQVLYFLESDQRFNTIDEALAFAKQNRPENTLLAAQAAKAFEKVANETNLLVISSVSSNGVPSSRLMRFVKSGRPGVWYVSTPAEGPKVREFDEGRVAIVTFPTDDGESLNSNRIDIRRAPFALDKIADLFEEQVPGYLDGVTEEEQQRELALRADLAIGKSRHLDRSRKRHLLRRLAWNSAPGSRWRLLYGGHRGRVPRRHTPGVGGSRCRRARGEARRACLLRQFRHSRPHPQADRDAAARRRPRVGSQA